MSETYWMHGCVGTPQRDSNGKCLDCGKQTAWDGQATVEEVEPMTEAEQLAIVRDKVTIPSLKVLYARGLVGGKTVVTYPAIRREE